MTTPTPDLIRAAIADAEAAIGRVRELAAALNSDWRTPANPGQIADRIKACLTPNTRPTA